MCNSCNSWSSYNRCGCCGATQFICRDAWGNIRVNQCGYNANTAQTGSCYNGYNTNTTQTSSCRCGYTANTAQTNTFGCCGTTGNTTTTDTNSTNGNSNGFGFFTVYGRIVNCYGNTATTQNGNGCGCYSRQCGRCRWGFGSAD